MKIRLSVALFLIGIEMIAMATLSLIPRNYLYYLACMPFNAAIVVLLFDFPESRLVDTIQRLNVWALIFQGFGFISYWLSWPIVIYNSAIHTISFLQIWKILTIGGDNGLAGNDAWRAVVRSLPTLRSAILPEKERKCTTS